MNDKQNYQQAHYLTSVAGLEQLPADVGYEVAFIGRSNAGKSSALNTITSIKGLARTSQTPGRTQMINLFSLDDDRRLVDLPGYGYAKVPLSIRERWMYNVNEYLKIRECLAGLVLIMDIRHPLKETDQHLIQWASQCQLPLHILLTKADKLSTSEQRKVLQEVQSELKIYPNISLQTFSSMNRQGLEEARAKLDEWFEPA